MATSRVQDKYKSRLFLTQSGGFRGFFAQGELLQELTYQHDTCKFLHELVVRGELVDTEGKYAPPFVHVDYEHFLSAFRKDFPGLLQYFSLLRSTRLRNRIAAVSLLLDLLDDDKSGVNKEIRAQPAFYESLIDLLIKDRRE